MSKRYKEISDFIRNGEQSRIIESKFSNRYNTMYVKSRITDRFYSIYREDSTDTFFSDNLKFIAIYDREEDRLFNVDYSFEYDIKQGDFDIELSEMDFGKIKKEIYSKINHKIQDYAISYAETLKIEAYDDYMNQEEYIFKHHKESSEKYFLTHCCDYLLEDSSLLNQSKITDGININMSYLYKTAKWDSNQIVLDYLMDSLNTVENESNNIIADQNNRKELGVKILNLELDAAYICDIQQNSNGVYDFLHKRKDIISCLEKKDAVNVTIKIKYDLDTFEFKFDRSRLLRDLKDPSCLGSSDYGKAYNQVENFLSEHKQECSSWDKSKFDFQNICKITYSNKTLYLDKNLDNVKENYKNYDLKR